MQDLPISLINSTYEINDLFKIFLFDSFFCFFNLLSKSIKFFGENLLE